MRIATLALLGVLWMTGCAAETDAEVEEMGETSSSIASSDEDVAGWLAAQRVQGDELDAILDEEAPSRTAGGLFSGIGKAIAKINIGKKLNLGGIGKLLGDLRLRISPDVFVHLELRSDDVKSTAGIENAVRIVQIQAAVRDGAALEPVAEKSSARLAARFGGKASQYRVYAGGEYEGKDGTTIDTRVFVRTGGKSPKVVAIRTVTRERTSGSPRVTDLPKGVL